MEDLFKLRSASGIPYVYEQDSRSVGPRGPLLLEDYILHEKMAHFNRERIPERVVHAKGSAAFGTFTVTKDITRYTRAKLFNQLGKQTKIILRMSTIAGEKGSADSERDPRGFAVKFYTEDGNWDLVGNNTPVFFIKDPKKFSDFIHSQKRDPYHNLRSATRIWDFFSFNPESLHQVLILMSNRGTPYGLRHMHGYGSHAFSMINAKNERVYVKFHFRTQQGIKNFSHDEALQMRSADPDFSQRDLFEAIESGNFPKWTLFIQVMTTDQCSKLAFNPFDITKTWSQKEFPLIEVGVLELNKNPSNYFAQVEQLAFAPAHVIDGISYSPDKVLQGRILSYPDAQRYRLGVNYEQIPVNQCLFAVHNYQRDGLMTVTNNGDGSANYYPNSFDQLFIEHEYKELPIKLGNAIADWYDRNSEGENDHYSQPGVLFREVLDDKERGDLCLNIIKSMQGITGEKSLEIIHRQLYHFCQVDQTLAQIIAEGLGVSPPSYQSSPCVKNQKINTPIPFTH
ncbi:MULTISPECIES: catalase [Olivibacter]|uniref:catalase n=1 Tax=Olivibacter jilunii TaxID=985016 RepID=A0ABW6B0H6_9SPHI